MILYHLKNIVLIGKVLLKKVKGKGSKEWYRVDLVKDLMKKWEDGNWIEKSTNMEIGSEHKPKL